MLAIGTFDYVINRVRPALVYAGGTFGSQVCSDGARRPADPSRILSLINDHYGEKIFTGDRIFVGYDDLSENLDKRNLARILYEVKRALVKGHEAVIVTHGTDAMEQTVTYVDNWLKDHAHLFEQKFDGDGNKRKAVVFFTGSNHPLDAPNTDAWGNLTDALKLANIYFHPSGVTKDYINSGAYVVFGGRLVETRGIRKQPFVTDPKGMSYCNNDDLTIDPDKLTLWDERRSVLLRHYGLSSIPTSSPVVIHNVNCIRENHDEFLGFVQERKPKAVLLILYHSGTANTKSPEGSVSKLTEPLRKQGIVPFCVTENGEPVDLKSYGTSVDLRKAGLVPLYNMSFNDATLKLMILSSRYSGVDLIYEMLTNHVGEIDPTAINDVQDLVGLYSEK